MAVAIQPSPGVFHQALKQLGDQRVMQFGSFDEYKKRTDFPRTDTAKAISVQTLATVNPELRARKVMVVRCGSEKRLTRFALARASCWPDDYFIRDKGFDPEPKTFVCVAPSRELFSFSLINPVEMTLVNLALTTGVLATALDLDDHDYGPPGATGSSPYSFKFRPHSSDSTVVSHEAGQVEIDLLFVAQQNGREAVFVVEAKQDKAIYGSDHPRSSLAKHKLLFPVLAIRPQVPSGMEIVPVYLKASVGEDNIDFHIAECSPFEGGVQTVACVDVMTVVRRESLRLPNQFAKAKYALDFSHRPTTLVASRSFGSCDCPPIGRLTPLRSLWGVDTDRAPSRSSAVRSRQPLAVAFARSRRQTSGFLWRKWMPSL